MSYPGGKNGSGVYQAIINLIPPHKIYIEPFLGAGAIMRNKRPAESSIAIDIDGNVINNFSDPTTPNLTLLQLDAILWLKNHNPRCGTFIYIDPPYLMETRSSKRKIYSNELTTQDHIAILDIVLKMDCQIMISGYPNTIYDDALKGWHTATFNTTTRGGKYVKEKLWMNYEKPKKLHDYRYIGKTFRERERIKRKIERWTSRLLMLPDLEKNAIAAAIVNIGDDGQYRQIKRAAPDHTIKNDAAGSLAVNDDR